MKCPKCDFDIMEYDEKYSNCKEPVDAIKKCIKISNRLYNEGLNLAQKGEISNAINVIEKSILFNKRNIDSRNLVGLLYYKIGHYADAMKHWIISTNFEKDKTNLACKYIGKIGKNMREFEKGNDAIRLYNQAIKYLNQKNDDLAMIRLKNAIKISPNFVEAFNLLTFCYIVQEKNKKALEMAYETLKIDINNKRALYYIKEITKNNSLDGKILDKEYVFNGKVEMISEDNEELPKEKYKNKNLISIAYCIFSIVISVLFMYFLYIPDYKAKTQEEINNLTVQTQEAKQAYETLQTEINTLNEQLKNENNNLKNKVTELEKSNSLIENKAKVKDAIILIKEGKRKDAKKIFETIDTTGFTDEDMEKYEYVKARV